MPEEQDPYAAIAKPIESGAEQDPYAAIAKPLPDRLKENSNPTSDLEAPAPKRSFGSSIGDVADTVVHHLAGVVTGPYHAAFDPVSDAERQQDSSADETLDNPVSKLLYRTAIEPSIEPATQAVRAAKWGDYGTAADRALHAVPIVGPALSQAESDADKHGIIAAGAGMLTDLATAKAGEGAVKKVSSAFASRTNMPGLDYTPRQHESLSSVLSEGSGAGNGYIAPDIAKEIGPILRQTAADNAAIADVIHKGTPKESVAAFQGLLDQAKRSIDVQHNTALEPHATSPVNMKPVVDSLEPSSAAKEGMTDVDLKDIEDLKSRAGKIKTLGGLNEFRKMLSQEDSGLQKAGPIAVGRGSVYGKAVHDLYGTVRDHYYDALSNASGQDFQPIKRTEASIIKAQEGMGNASPRLINRNARDIAPKTAGPLAADLIDGGHQATTGHIPIVSKAAEALRGNSLDQIQGHLKRFFSNLPEPTLAATPPVSRFTRAPKLLPSGQGQLPASIIPNADIAGSAAAPSSTPPTGFNVSPEGTVRPGPTPPQGPSVITPAPDAIRALPAQAGPEGTGVPEVPPPTAPPLNRATASQRTNPPLPANPQAAPRGPGFTVDAQGKAVRTPAALLPPPEAAKFSRSAWLDNNPKGNVEAAAKRAAAKGYKVVD